MTDPFRVLPSSYQLGDSIDAIHENRIVRAEVVGVRFTAEAVYYDLAVGDSIIRDFRGISKPAGHPVWPGIGGSDRLYEMTGLRVKPDLRRVK